MTNTLLKQLIATEIRLADPSAGNQDLIQILVEAETEIDADGNIVVVDQNGAPRLRSDGGKMTVGDLVGQLRGSKSTLFNGRASEAQTQVSTLGSPPHPGPLKPGDNITEHALKLKAFEPEARKARAAALAAEGNPWRAATKNLTHQFMILGLDPELAHRLKAEAGAD